MEGGNEKKTIRYVIENDDQTEKQVEDELKNKEKQKNKLKSCCVIYRRWSEQLLRNIRWW